MNQNLLTLAYMLGLKRARDIARDAALKPGGRDMTWQMIEEELDKLRRAVGIEEGEE